MGAFSSFAFFSKTVVVSWMRSLITMGVCFFIIPAFSKAMASRVFPNQVI